MVASKKIVPTSGRKDYLDALVPGLALRVTQAGHKSYVLIARYPSHPTNPTRRALGEHGVISLEQAREQARIWIALVKRGIDPKVEEARQRSAEQRRQNNSFAAVAEEFLQRHAAKLAKAADARHSIETEFVRFRERHPLPGHPTQGQRRNTQ